MEGNLSVLFEKGGWVMWPLLVFSVLTWAVIFERIYTYLSLKPKLAKLGAAAIQLLRSGDIQGVKQIALNYKPVVSQVFLTAIDTGKARDLAERQTERNRVRLMHHLKKNLWILGTIGSASPFLGLFGTVMGILKSFHKMSTEGAGGFSVVAGGISEALIATAAGLIVAIIALIMYNVFVTVSNSTVNQVKLSTEELLDLSFTKA